jgi:hypothetical protein
MPQMLVNNSSGQGYQVVWHIEWYIEFWAFSIMPSQLLPDAIASLVSCLNSRTNVEKLSSTAYQIRYHKMVTVCKENKILLAYALLESLCCWKYFALLQVKTRKRMKSGAFWHGGDSMRSKNKYAGGSCILPWKPAKLTWMDWCTECAMLYLSRRT